MFYLALLPACWWMLECSQCSKHPFVFVSSGQIETRTLMDSSDSNKNMGWANFVSPRYKTINTISIQYLHVCITHGAARTMYFFSFHTLFFSLAKSMSMSTIPICTNAQCYSMNNPHQPIEPKNDLYAQSPLPLG